MKFHMLPIAIFFASLFWIVAATVRWFWIWPDHSQLVIAILVGLGGMYVAYDLNWKKNRSDKDDEQDNRMNAFSNWFTRNVELADEKKTN